MPSNEYVQMTTVSLFGPLQTAAELDEFTKDLLELLDRHNVGTSFSEATVWHTRPVVPLNRGGLDLLARSHTQFGAGRGGVDECSFGNHLFEGQVVVTYRQRDPNRMVAIVADNPTLALCEVSEHLPVADLSVWTATEEWNLGDLFGRVGR